MYSSMIETGLDQDTLDLQRQRQLFDGPTPPKSLWITCNHHGMDHVVERVLEAEPAFVLRRPFNRLSACTGLESEQMSAIDYAVDGLGVTTITICGHTAFDGIRQNPAAKPAMSRRYGACSPHRFSGLVQRVREQQSLFAQARQNVVDQLTIVAAYPSAARRIAEGRLGLFGLLLTDSGIFLRYDDQTGEFLSINPSIHSAM